MQKSFVINIILLVNICWGHNLPDGLQATERHMHSFQTHPEDFQRFKRSANGYESTSHFWQIEAQKKLSQKLKQVLNENIAKNVIFFLGDGMSVATVSAGRIYSGQKLGFSGEESSLSFEEFPYVGLSKVS